AGEEVHAEHLLAGVRAGEAGDDVARDGAADVVAAEAGLLRVVDERLDLDHLAPFGLGGSDNAGDGHGAAPQVSSRHAARVAITSAPPDHSDPSLMRAIAVMRCVAARRMLVCTRAAPERGPK